MIFLKFPLPGADNDLTDVLPLVFAWTKTDAAGGYTLKFSLVPNFPADATFSLDVGDVNEYLMDNDAVLEVFNTLSPKEYFKYFYWTVMPTTQTAPIKNQFRLLKVWKLGVFYQNDRTGWEAVGASSTLGGYPLSQAIDGSLNTFWHSSDVALPHWFIIDMKIPKAVFKFDVYRTSGNFSDTKRVELYLGDGPEAFGSWKKIGEGSFSSSTTGTTEPFIEVLATDNVTEGRYFKLQLLDGRAGTNPYVNVSEIYLFYQDK